MKIFEQYYKIKIKKLNSITKSIINMFLAQLNQNLLLNKKEKYNLNYKFKQFLNQINYYISKIYK